MASPHLHSTAFGNGILEAAEAKEKEAKEAQKALERKPPSPPQSERKLEAASSSSQQAQDEESSLKLADVLTDAQFKHLAQIEQRHYQRIGNMCF